MCLWNIHSFYLISNESKPHPLLSSSENDSTRRFICFPFGALIMKMQFRLGEYRSGKFGEV